MPKPVVMPQMGESVAEGTIVRWLKKVGDPVERDEPLFEISTDKVDAEIPSPIAGVVSEIKVKEGETVPINTVVGVVDEAATAASTSAPVPPAKTVPAPVQGPPKAAPPPAPTSAPKTPSGATVGKPSAPAAAPKSSTGASAAAAVAAAADETARQAPTDTCRTLRTDG